MMWADSNLVREEGKSPVKILAKRAAIAMLRRWVTLFLPIHDRGVDYWRHYGVAQERIAVLPLAMDLKRFREKVQSSNSADIQAVYRKYRIPSDKRLVLFCGKIQPWKRPHDMLDAVKRLPHEVFAVFVGDGALRGEIEAAADGRAVVTGFVNQDELPLVLSLGDVLVLPSVTEAYGMVPGEGMAVGVPAVVSDRCGCVGPNGTVRHGETGLVYTCGQIEELTEKLRQALYDTKLRERLIVKGSEWIEHFSAVGVAGQVVGYARRAQAIFHAVRASVTEPQ